MTEGPKREGPEGPRRVDHPPLRRRIRVERHTAGVLPRVHRPWRLTSSRSAISPTSLRNLRSGVRIRHGNCYKMKGLRLFVSDPIVLELHPRKGDEI